MNSPHYNKVTWLSEKAPLCVSKSAKILARAATGVADAIRRGGGSPAAIMAEAGIDPKLFRDPDARIALARFVQLFHIAALRTGDDCFGLHFGIGYDRKELGLAHYITVNSATVGDALRGLERYHRLFRTGTETKVDVIGDRARYCFRIVDRTIGNRRQDSERVMGSVLNSIRELTEPDWCPLEAHFEHPEPADTSEHRRIFGALLRFSQPANCLIFERALLGRRIHTADLHLRGVLQRHADEALEKLPTDDDLTMSLRKLIAPKLHEGHPSIERAAGELGMSVRTLQRRLRESSVNFSQLIEEIRYHLAREYLDKPELAVSEIAYLLGYSELSAFNHAFRRWAGAAPLDYRRRHATPVH